MSIPARQFTITPANISLAAGEVSITTSIRRFSVVPSGIAFSGLSVSASIARQIVVEPRAIAASGSPVTITKSSVAVSTGGGGGGGPSIARIRPDTRIEDRRRQDQIIRRLIEGPEEEEAEAVLIMALLAA